MSTPEHVAMIEATVARQRAFFQTGATRPVAVRVAALHKLKREMQARETILLDALYADLQRRFPQVEITVSGGVSSPDDIARLEREGLRSVIVGKALYEGRITLEKPGPCSPNA